MKIRIRFNKTRGQAGRGTVDHVWRIFDENNKEYLVKNVIINVPTYGEKEANTEDWNIVANGEIKIHKETSTIEIF